MAASPQSPIPNPKTLYLIDGSGFIFRAYHAIRPLTDPQGTPVNAVFGFVSMIMKLMEGPPALHANDIKGQPLAGGADCAAVIFDAGRKTFRNEIYPEYKAHRPPPPDDLIPQFALVREATRALNLPCIEMADFEADDIIATYAKQAASQGFKVTIVSSDKDLMQLISDDIQMYDAMKERQIGAAEVMEKFGVGPDKVLEVQSLIGDSSDNVPGVPGIGPKTASELINKYGNLENLLSSLHDIKQTKRREALEQHAEKARLSRQLVTLKCDVPGLAPIESLALRQPQLEQLSAFLTRHGFKSLITRAQKKFNLPMTMEPLPSQPSLPQAPVPGQQHYAIVRDEAELSAWIAKAMKKGAVAFDTETTSLNALQAELVGFSLCVEPGEACYVPLLHRVQGSEAGVQGNNNPQEPDLFSLTSDLQPLAPGQIPLKRAIALIKPLLEDGSVLKIGHNIKYDLLVMQRYGIWTNPIEDTMLLSYLLHAGEHGQGMDELAERYLRHKCISYDEVTGTGRNRLRFDQVEIEKAGEYAAEDADVTLRMHQHFKPRLIAEKMTALYETIERPLVRVLARMEAAGIKIDMAQLTALSADFGKRMHELEREIHALAGMEFNVGSPKQLGEVLFDKLQLPGGRKSSKTGAYTTDSDVLEELAGAHPLPARVLEWRQLAKLKSTYTDTLAEQADPQTKRVHTCYAMAIASTGRLSSTDPNLQNIPIRTEEGRKIRRCFIAEKGCKLLSADYSQIELRLLAHVADIAPLKEAFRNGDDIHAITASQMFGVPVSEVSGELRRSAKTINFGIIYGISAHGLATRLGIGRSEAAAYIEKYFAQYPGIRDYMEEAKDYARRHGYVTTLFGRRCHVPGIKSSNGGVRQFSERAAINAPLQGTAADIIKRAMVAIDRDLDSRLDARMLLQVHDELVFEVTEAAAEGVRALVKKRMEQAADLSVPLTVETGIGNHWGDAH